MSKDKRVRIIFDADIDFRTEIKILAARKGKSVSELIRDALEKVYPNELKTQA